MRMATWTMDRNGIVDVPYCRICRRSSELKWRKHVFSKSHQRAAAELLAARVAELTDRRARLASRDEERRCLPTTYCVFCEVKLASWRQWIEHFGSASHLTTLREFCKHHRCDASQELRPRLCLTAEDVKELTKLLDEKEAALKPAAEEPAATAHSEPKPSAHTNERHVQTFLESATARLQQVRAARAAESANRIEPPAEGAVETKASWMGPHTNPFVRVRTVTSSDGIQQNPLGRHDGKRVWGGGIVKVRKSEWIQWGIDLLVLAEEEQGLGEVVSSNDTYQHQLTESARAVGLQSISRVEWGENVGNIHSAAIPPWMVDTEEEYRHRNQRSSEIQVPTPTALPQQAPAILRASFKSRAPTDSTTRDDIFTRLKPTYDEKTWLPNFGGVWQEGPRYKTRNEFRKTVSTQRPYRVSTGLQPRTEFRPLRSAHLSPSEGNAKPDKDNSVTTTQEIAGELLDPPKEASAPSVAKPVTETPPANLDAKKILLIAQKERLRAKVAAKRLAVPQ